MHSFLGTRQLFQKSWKLTMQKLSNEWKFHVGLGGLWKDLEQVNPPSFLYKIDKSMTMVWTKTGFKKGLWMFMVSLFISSSLLIHLTIPSLSTRLHQALTESTRERSEPLRRVLPYWHRRRHATPLGTCGKATHWIQPPGGQLEEKCWKVCMCVLWWTHFGERGTPMLRDLYKFEYREWFHCKTLYIVVFIENP